MKQCPWERFVKLFCIAGLIHSLNLFQFDIQGHLGEVWGLATSPDGLLIASSSRDGSIRLWEKTQEIMVLEDERETEMAEEENKELEAELLKNTGNATAGVESNPESGLASLMSLGGEDAVCCFKKIFSI